MKKLGGVIKNFDEISKSKNSLFYNRPWWLKWPLQTIGLVSMGAGTAITLGTLGLGTPMGASMIAGGAALFAGSYSSSDDIKRRHTLFDMAQQVAENEGETHLKTNPITGNFFPYLKTYIPYSSARSSLHEAEAVYNEAKKGGGENLNSSVISAYSKLFTEGNQKDVAQEITKTSEKRAEAKRDSKVPNSSVCAKFCQRFTDMFRSKSSDRSY